MQFLQIIRGFDRNPAYVSINYNGRKVHKSRTGGCISIILLISVVFIFFFKIFQMFQQQNLSFQTLLGKSDFGAVNLSDAQIRITIKDQEDNEEIPCKNLSKYNLQVYFEWKQIYKQSVEKNLGQQTQMIPCSAQSNQTNYCIKDTNLLTLLGRLDVPKIQSQGDQTKTIIDKQQSNLIYRQFRIKLNEISKNNSDNFNQTKKVIPFITFKNHVINQQKKDINKAIFKSQQRVFKTDSPLTINSNKTQKKTVLHYKFQIKKVIMVTDYSILPSTIKDNLPIFQNNQQITQSWFYGEEFSAQTYTEQEKNQLLVVIFMRSMYTNTYLRHFDKLDTVLAEAFALTGLLSMILFCIYQGYNGWVLEKQNIGQQKSVNICHFYVHQLKNFCYFVAKIIEKFLKCLRLYNCVKWIQKKLCFCLFKKQYIEQRTQSFLNHKRLEQELDIYRSRRQINFLKKRMQVMHAALQIIGKKVPEVQSLLDRQIRLSAGYEMTPSLISSFKSHEQMEESQISYQEKTIQQYKEASLLKKINR